MRTLCLTVALLACAVPAHAQSFEIGASIATSCIGSDGSFCDDNGLATFGPYASVWFGDRLELSGRVAWLHPREYGGPIFDAQQPATFRVGDRGRRLTQVEAIWHFGRGTRVRPFVGLGLGRYYDREVTTCTPAGCEPMLARSGLGTGDHRQIHGDASTVVGLSVAATPRLLIRGGWRYHNPFRDELALSELFATVGYRF